MQRQFPHCLPMRFGRKKNKKKDKAYNKLSERMEEVE